MSDRTNPPKAENLFGLIADSYHEKTARMDVMSPEVAEAYAAGRALLAAIDQDYYYCGISEEIIERFRRAIT